MTSSKEEAEFSKLLYSNLKLFGETHAAEILQAIPYTKHPRDCQENVPGQSFSKLNAALRKCRILIVTANEVEYSAVTRLLAENAIDKKVERYVDKFNYQLAHIKLHESDDPVDIAHVHATDTSSGTDGGSSDAVNAALRYFTPNLVVSLGCAFGWNLTTQKIGDVLMSEEIIGYGEKHKRLDEKIILKQNTRHRIHDRLIPFLQAYKEKPTAFHKDHVDLTCETAPTIMQTSETGMEKTVSESESKTIQAGSKYSVFFGSMLCGPEVVDDPAEKQRLQRAAEAMGFELIGGEMEGTGVRRACRSRKSEIPWLIIKGISDWGIGKHNLEPLIDAMVLRLEPNSRFGEEDIANALQALATIHAFETLLQVLRDNPQLTEDNSPFRRFLFEAERTEWNKALKAAWIDWKLRMYQLQRAKQILGILCIYLPIAMSVLVAMGLTKYVSLTVAPIYRTSFYVLAVGMLLVGVWLIYSSFRRIPLILSDENAAFSLQNHNPIDSCQTQDTQNWVGDIYLKNLSKYPIYQVESIWLDYPRLSRPTITKEQSFWAEIKPGNTICLLQSSVYNSPIISKSFWDKALLQISYSTMDSVRFIHLFSFNAHDKTYQETVYRYRGGKLKRRAVIMHTLNHMNSLNPTHIKK